MPRKPRDDRPGYHHVVSRGNNKQTIYLSDADRISFLALLDRVATRHCWDILTYCLMRNHYHLVLRVGESGLSSGMCELNGVYAMYFNSEHGRVDHLFGRRFWSELTKTDAHLRNAIRYALQNPRRAGARGPLESHPWTSYRATIGHGSPLSRFARDELLDLFAFDPVRAVPAFMAFCEQPPPPRPAQCPPPPRPAQCQAPSRNRRLAVT